jgi:NADH-quinone oxidoreductase subunit F
MTQTPPPAESAPEPTPFEPVLTVAMGQPESWTMARYRARGGYDGARKAVTTMTAEEIIKVVTDSKLRGRGGAGFPAGIKWGGTRSNPAPRYLVVNADESEPGSFANRIAMDSDPHMLLEGMIICSFAIDAHAAYIYIRGENLHGFEVLEGAVREAREAGFLGRGIFGTNYELEIYVHRGAGAYVCGEETALMESLEGKRGQPRTRPPHPFQVGGGVFGRPTVVNNVETLMCAPHIINRGAEWFAGIGSPNCPGPKVYCVSGNVTRPGVYEAPMGLPLRELIYGEAYGQGVPGGRAVKAVSPGALASPMISGEMLDVKLDTDAVRAPPYRTQLGAGGIMVYDDRHCMVELLVRTEEFFAHESCGKCVPCREGTHWMADVLQRIAAGQGREEDLKLLLEVATNMSGLPFHQRTLCALADFAAGPVLSAIPLFKEDFEAHIREGACPKQRQLVHA